MCCPAGVFPAGIGGLLKLSQPGRNWQAWKILASLAETGKPGSCWQAGKYWEVSEARRYWGIFFAENNGRGSDGNI